MVQISNNPSYSVIRIKFKKTGDLQYISHLDLVRTMHKIIVRANLPLWYTEGFNPKPKMVFAAPLSIGAESLCEFMDLRVTEQISPDEVKDRLNANMTHEMQVIEAYEPTSKFQDIAWARYQMKLSFAGADESTAAQLQDLFTTSPLTMLKKSKSGEREIDLIPMIKKIKVTCNPDRPEQLHISAILAASGSEYLNPEMLISAAKRECGILGGDPANEEYTILRTHVYHADGVSEFR